MKYVYVVTNTQLGWDCVVGVYDNEDAAKEHANSYGRYAIVFEQQLQSNFEYEE